MDLPSSLIISDLCNSLLASAGVRCLLLGGIITNKEWRGFSTRTIINANYLYYCISKDPFITLLS